MKRAIPIAVSSVPAARAEVPAAAWRWRTVLASPHRLAFVAGSLMLVVSALWWLVAIASRSLPGLALPWAVAPTLAHAVLMVFGFMPLFFTGFLFTAGPKWLALAPVDARTLLPTVLAVLAGWGTFLVGVTLIAPLAAFGLAAVAVGFSSFAWRFVALVRASALPDRVHAKVVASGCVVGAASLWLATAGLLLEDATTVFVAVGLALWWFVAPVYAAVSHRMIPFFTASALPLLDAWRPMWLLAAWLALLVVQPLLQWAEPLWRGAAALLAAIDIAGGVLMLVLALRWGLVRSLSVRLLAMLHIGFAWFGIAMLLQGISSALVASGHAGLGLAPLHALTMGFLGSVLMAMVTRVSCGHGGRPLEADAFAWRLFGLHQLAVLLRVIAALQLDWSGVLLPLAALAWAGAAVPWSLRHLGWYGRPRPDGRPG